MDNPEALLYPPIDPYQQEWLQVSALHRIYYEQCGNPDGQPVVVLHGGPGSGCAPTQRRFFDPAHYRIVLFDQRGCKRSQPLGCIEENTTADLVEDLERLRAHLGITNWVVFGGSWGSTLALAYALAYPTPISALILRGIFLCRPGELDWFFREVRRFFPEAWEKFAAPAGNVTKNADLLGFYRDRIYSSNPDVAVGAATTWSNFEADIMSLLPGTPSSSAIDNETIIGRARVQLHYLSNQGFIDGDRMLARIDEIRHIPAKIIQGRYDMVCPPCTAYELHQAWSEAQFMMIPDAGHSAMEPGIVRALMLAAQSFAQAR